MYTNKCLIKDLRVAYATPNPTVSIFNSLTSHTYYTGKFSDCPENLNGLVVERTSGSDDVLNIAVTLS